MDTTLVVFVLATFLATQGSPVPENPEITTSANEFTTTDDEEMTTETSTYYFYPQETRPPATLEAAIVFPEEESVVVETDDTGSDDTIDYDSLEDISKIAKSASGEGDYRFRYSVRDSDQDLFIEREEQSNDGLVTGFYSYLRPDHVLVTVTYEAGPQGFVPFISETPFIGLQSLDRSKDITSKSTE